MQFAEVAIAGPMHRAFTYSVPDGMSAQPGSRLVVPFGKRRVVGICVEACKAPPQGMAEGRIRPIIRTFDERPVLSENLLKLIRWISSYYVAPIGEVCRGALPSRLLKPEGPKTTRPMSPSEIMPMSEERFELNADQRSALGAILSAMAAPRNKTFLLHGITGSGKTEVYLRVFAELAKSGKQGLLLVPEIGLTPLLTARTAARFGRRVAVYHSGLTDAQRHEQWTRIKSGEVDVVVGTRSALFAPIPNLGAIVVDEEHDGSYKQDEGFIYHGRDAAVVRAQMEGAVAILGSATPSLESMSNADSGKYERLMLHERTGDAVLPDIEIIDMRNRNRKGLQGRSHAKRQQHSELLALSPELYEAIGSALGCGEQVLLYAGRRGFAGFIQCDSCGDVFTCPNCDISLTAHAMGRGSRGYLLCHYCDYKIPEPGKCKTCGSPNIIPVGIGTERLEAEISDFFPNAKIARLDSDMAAKASTRKKIFSDMSKGRLDILIGTQMVAKGHDFPAITLVGVISADTTLSLPDFRSAERTFQLITQVAGRAGRGTKPGRVIIQTRQPDHYSLIAAGSHDCGAFASCEMRHRREMGYPPYSRLANVRISSVRRDVAEDAAKAAAGIFHRILTKSPTSGITILGPAPAAIERLRGRWRWQILIKSSSSGVLSRLLQAAHPIILEKLPRSSRLTIDVDPVNMM